MSNEPEESTEKPTVESILIDQIAAILPIMHLEMTKAISAEEASQLRKDAGVEKHFARVCTVKLLEVKLSRAKEPQDLRGILNELETYGKECKEEDAGELQEDKEDGQ